MKQARILVVEDDGILALFLMELLIKLDYAVLPPAATGEEAVRQAVESQPDLILMDIKLIGEMNGITAASMIAEKTAIPVIFLTSFSQKSILELATRTAPYGYLVKPVSEHNLATAVETALFKSKLDQQMKVNESHFRNLADTVPALIWMSGLDAQITYVNTPWLAFTGRKLEQELGNGWTEGIHPEDYQDSMDTYQSAFSARQEFKMEYRLRRNSGEYAWMLVSGVPRFTPAADFIGFIGSCVDINHRKLMEAALKDAKTALELANQQLEQAFEREQQLARTDALTGTNNRRYFYELARYAIDVAVRYSQPLSLISFDVDEFKKVNDTFGHSNGDQILIQTIQAVTSQLRTTDILGRIGGDEFAIIMPGIHARQAYSLAERIRTKLFSSGLMNNLQTVTVTISIGIAGLASGSSTGDLETLMHQADMALYAAKRAGRNQAKVYQPGMRS